MAKPGKTIALIIPDTSPLLSLARVGRLDILSVFTIPIRIVDVVAEEARRPQNDINGNVRMWLDSRPNSVEIVNTNTGDGVRFKREKGLNPKTGNLGEIAVDEYATDRARHENANAIPMVLFEDPDVLELRIARLKGVHLINTAALLIGLHAIGAVPDALDVLDTMNALRKTLLKPIERIGRTKKAQSTWISAVDATQK